MNERSAPSDQVTSERCPELDDIIAQFAWEIEPDPNKQLDLLMSYLAILQERTIAHGIVFVATCVSPGSPVAHVSWGANPTLATAALTEAINVIEESRYLPPDDRPRTSDVK
jgi:hypothetical protein